MNRPTPTYARHEEAKHMRWAIICADAGEKDAAEEERKSADTFARVAEIVERALAETPTAAALMASLAFAIPFCALVFGA
jgi:hypothetical protein